MFLAGLLFPATTGMTGNPEPELAADRIADRSGPTIEYAGTDVIITGSVGDIFDDSTFSGPNRADKVARQRPGPDVMEVARSFDEVRQRIAALREPPAVKTLTTQQRIAIAAIDPRLVSSALSAIDDVDTSTADGLPAPAALPETLAYARANTPATSFKTPVSRKLSEREKWCLATAVYFEARGEPYRGQVAVAQVVMNRVNHTLYPNTVCGVVFQNQSRRNACQFSFACDGIPERVTEKEAWAQAQEIAEKVAGGSLYLSEVANATHYHATYVRPRWAPRMDKVVKIGLHVFYRFRKGWTAG